MYTIGLSKIEIGDIANDGGMGKNLEILGETLEDTVKFEQEDPETTDFFCEEKDDPVLSISKAGKSTFTFSLMNPSLEVLQTLIGGKITPATTDENGNDVPEKWSPPSNMPIIEKSVKITPRQGLVFEIPRLKIIAKINGEFSKKGLLLVEVNGTALQPTKAGVEKYDAYRVA
jgi:hypothetical protein